LRSARAAWQAPGLGTATALRRKPGAREEKLGPGVTVRSGSTTPALAGNRSQGRENGRSNRISEVWHYHLLALSLQCGRPRPGKIRRRAGTPTVAIEDWSQLDFVGHDPKGAPL
jgi:hypothetical protein